MNNAQVNALIATSFNLHFGKARNEVMTPAKAAKLSRGDRAALCMVLEQKGGSDLYSQEQAKKAYAVCVS